MTTFPAIIALSSLDGVSGFRVDGAAANDQSGISVSDAGDVNRDGFRDFIVGASRADPGGAGDAGSSYVVFGQASGFGTSFSLSTLDGSDGFRLDGVAAGDKTGWSVSSAGDVNDDGFADLIVGAPFANGGAGASYVVFGKADFSTAATLALSSLDGLDGFCLAGIGFIDEQSGFSVSGAGDVNGDGFADLIVGNPLADLFDRTDTGMSYVMFGKASGFAPTMLLVALDSSGTDGFRLYGGPLFLGIPGTGDKAGFSVSGAGDVNGDGFADLIVGATTADSGAGRSYVVFGKADFSTSATLELTALNGSDGFRLEDSSGWSVSSAGDVNGDGFGDLIVGAPGAFPNFNYGAGSTYVVFGRADFTGTASVDLSGLDGSDGFRLDGGASFDSSGWSVSGAGDINGDGFADLIVGALGADPNGSSYAGASYVIYGRAPIDPVTRTGTAIGNTIRGGSGGDTLSGLGGNDRLYGAGDSDLMLGGAGRDRLTGGTGGDTLAGGDDDDLFLLADGDFEAGEEINGESGADTIQLTDATVVDFSQGTLIGVERLKGSADADTVTLTGSQWAAFDRIMLGDGSDTLLVMADGDISASGRPGVVGVETGGLVGTSGSETITLDGRQLDAILIGAATIDLGDGFDGMTLFSGSRDLAAVAASDSALNGVETLQFFSKTNLDLSAQSEGFQVGGSSSADRLTGSAGSDFLHGGGGNDVLTGGGSFDSFAFLAPAANGLDTITDFALASDKLFINRFLFSGLVASGHQLPLAAFFSSADPLTDVSGSGNGRFLYDTFGAHAGTLYWDGDGGAGANAIAFVKLTGAPTLSAFDFVIQ